LAKTDSTATFIWHYESRNRYRSSFPRPGLRWEAGADSADILCEFLGIIAQCGKVLQECIQAGDFQGDVRSGSTVTRASVCAGRLSGCVGFKTPSSKIAVIVCMTIISQILTSYARISIFAASRKRFLDHRGSTDLRNRLV
jgi:hypothetical protein